MSLNLSIIGILSKQVDESAAQTFDQMLNKYVNQARNISIQNFLPAK